MWFASLLLVSAFSFLIPEKTRFTSEENLNFLILSSTFFNLSSSTSGGAVSITSDSGSLFCNMSLFHKCSAPYVLYFYGGALDFSGTSLSISLSCGYKCSAYDAPFFRSRVTTHNQLHGSSVILCGSREDPSKRYIAQYHGGPQEMVDVNMSNCILSGGSALWMYNSPTSLMKRFSMMKTERLAHRLYTHTGIDKMYMEMCNIIDNINTSVVTEPAFGLLDGSLLSIKDSVFVDASSIVLFEVPQDLNLIIQDTFISHHLLTNIPNYTLINVSLTRGDPIPLVYTACNPEPTSIFTNTATSTLSPGIMVLLLQLNMLV